MGHRRIPDDHRKHHRFHWVLCLEFLAGAKGIMKKLGSGILVP